MTDIALVSNGHSPDRLHGLGRSGGPAKLCHGGIGGGRVPFFHCRQELSFRPIGLRQMGFIDLGEGPVPFLDVLSLGILEGVESPEHRQEAVIHRGGLAKQVRRVDHHHGVKFETDGMGLDVADAGEEEARHQVAVREPFLEVIDGDLDDSLSRSLLDPADDRLDLGAKPDDVGVHGHRRGAEGCDRAQERPIAKARTQPKSRGLQESPTPEAPVSVHHAGSRLSYLVSRWRPPSRRPAFPGEERGVPRRSLTRPGRHKIEEGGPWLVLGNVSWLARSSELTRAPFQGDKA